MRQARRRAALHVALREGDALTAARAWERLRIDGAVLTRREAVAARGARAMLGRAIREARERRTRSEAAQRMGGAAAEVMRLDRSVRARSRAHTGTAALSMLAAALILVVSVPVGSDVAPAAWAEIETQSQVLPVRAPTAGRGRTTATFVPEVAAATSPEPAPAPAADPTNAPPAQTAEPTAARAAPTVVPAPSVTPSAGPAGATAGTPRGVTSGANGGRVGGGGTAVASPTPKLNVMPLMPPALPSGSDRFLFHVVDHRTNSPLENVCVIYGTLQCGDADPHTNVLGYYWLDFPVRVSADWSFHFSRSGYATATVNKKYRAGQGTVITTIALRRRS